MIDAIAAVKKHGGIRAAAREHGIPYSTFQYMYHNQGGEPLRFNVTNIIDRRYAKILIFDLEVSPVDILHRTYGLKNQTRYYSPDRKSVV